MDNTTAFLLNSSTVAADEKSIQQAVDYGPIILGLLFFPGNVAALLFLRITTKTRRWTPFHRSVVVLILSDALGVGSTLILVYVQYGSGFSIQLTPVLCQFFTFCSSFGILSSAFIVCFMSCDRFLAITKPHAYRTVSKKYKTMNILGLIWLASLIVSALPLVGFGSAKLYPPGDWCFINFVSPTVEDRVYTILYSWICSCILISTFIINCAVIVALCRNSCATKVRRSNRKKHDIFPIILLIVYVMVFSVCLTPLTVTMLMSASFGDKTTGIHNIDMFVLAMFNAIIDPWIYLLLRKENFLSCLKCCRSRIKRFHKQNRDELNAVSRAGNSSKNNNLHHIITAETHM